MATKTKVSGVVENLLSGLVDRLEKLESTAVEQFPEICKEIIAERKVELQNQAIQMGFSSILVSAVGIAMAIETFAKENGDGRILWGLGALTAIGFGIASLSEFLNAFLKGRELTAAPKLYVIRQLRYLISKK